jgi:hypothetical protein
VIIYKKSFLFPPADNSIRNSGANPKVALDSKNIECSQLKSQHHIFGWAKQLSGENIENHRNFFYKFYLAEKILKSFALL